MSAASLALAGADLRALTSDVMDPTSEQPFGTYIFASHAPGAELARHIERVVFQEAFGNSPELLAREYGPYEDQSVFFLVIDHRRRLPAGMMRVVVPPGPSAGCSKTLDDLERVWGEQAEDAFVGSGARLDRAAVWDIATLAVAAGYRGKAARGLVSLALVQALIVALGRFRIDMVVALLDVAVLRLLQWQIGHPFVAIGGVAPRPYLGSETSLPVWSDVPAWRARLAEADPTMHALLCEGQGLEAAVAAAEWGPDALRLARAAQAGGAGLAAS